MKIHYYIVFIYLWAVYADELTPCTTPNGEAAFCVHLLKCPLLIQAVGSNEPSALQFLNASVCNEEMSIVCCGTAGNFKKTTLNEKQKFESLSKEEKRNYILKNVLPTQIYCGLQHTDDYPYYGTETSVDEFPWLVYISKKTEEDAANYYVRVESNCVGVLISNRYVLSTVSCLGGYKSTSFHTRDMLLGVHHIHKQINCIGTAAGVDDCTNPPLSVFSYNWEIYNDIVLFQLDKKIEYSDYVRPICLPLLPEHLPKAGSLVMASGWSEEGFVEGKRQKLKKRMKYTVMDSSECEAGNPLENAICGIPFDNNTHYICTGDIGGPLMYKGTIVNWFVVGLIDQRVDSCDEAQPAVAVRFTAEIVNWIVDQLNI